MTVYKNPSDFFEDLEEVVNEGFSQFVQETQGLLTSRAPIDTGRLASSFYISHGRPSSELRPAEWAPPGARKQSKPVYGGKIEADGTWYITNNVPYAYRTAYDPVYGKNGRGFGAGWYTATVNQNNKRFEDIMTRSLRKLK